MKPEEHARVTIDRQLTAAGWPVVNRNEYIPALGAAAIREALMQGQREADYMLMLHGKAVGVVEAKRADIKLDDADHKGQVQYYAQRILSHEPYWQLPLPLVYLANGKEILLQNGFKQDQDFKPQDRFLAPCKVQQLLTAQGVIFPPECSEFKLLPPLAEKGLRKCQFEAIQNFERSLIAGKKRALMVLATGAGKTHTACTLVHRLLAYTRQVRSVLFLVDRNNLGRAAKNAFEGYEVDGQRPFAQSYGVAELTSVEQLTNSNLAVRVCTIQRLYSILSGTEEEQEYDQERDNGEQAQVVLPEHALIKPDAFDLIIIDECHRSIYSTWGLVLSYFADHALLLGLTATPIKESLDFFQRNVVMDYTLAQSVADGINVPAQVYRIKTQLTEEGGEIKPGESLRVTSNYTGLTKQRTAQMAQPFAASELNRVIWVPDQIRTILSEYRDVVYTKLFPEREANFDYLPKTLIFARNENHAKLIAQIAKEVFDRTDDHFVQTITYSSPDSNAQIRAFRQNKDFRIAITVTLVATGTDVPPLEVLMFLTDVRSQVLYQQMKGRGVRTISDDHLREATPNAQHKDRYILVDAVGVTEHEKGLPQLTKDSPTTPNLERLLELLSHGQVSDDNMLLLAQKLTTIANRGDPDELAELSRIAPHLDLLDFARTINLACDPDFETYPQGELTRPQSPVKPLPPYIDSNEPNTERKELLAPLLNDLKARKKLIEIARGYLKLLPQQLDTLTYSDFSHESAQNQIETFERCLNELAQENKVVQAIRDNKVEVQVLSADTMDEIKQEIKQHMSEFTVNGIWNSYELLDRDKREQQAENEPPHVVPLNSANEDERDAVTNLLQLMRYAWHNSADLVSLANQGNLNKLFNLWCGQTQNDLPMDAEHKELYHELAGYIAINGAINDPSELYDLNPDLFSSLRSSFGSEAQRPLQSLNRFLLLRA